MSKITPTMLVEALRTQAEKESVLPDHPMMKVAADCIERLEQGLLDIDAWSRAYPLSVFPEPDMKRAREVLQINNMSLDAISASCMRHVLEGVQKIVKGALHD